MFNWEKIQGFFTLSISLAGTIAIPIIIWWFSSYKANKDKEEETQIKILNCIYGDLYGISNLILAITKEFNVRQKLWKEALLYLNSNRMSIDWTYYRNKYESLKIPFLATYYLKYSNLDITFISLESLNLYKDLFGLEKLIKNTQITMDDFMNRTYSNMDKLNNEIKTINLAYPNINLTKIEEAERSVKVSLVEEDFVLSQHTSILFKLRSFNDIIICIKRIIYELDNYTKSNFQNRIFACGKNYKEDFKEVLEYKTDIEQSLY
ncbi:MAG: hypothetical protein R3Y46_03610 [Opitutales bacterium]